MTDKTDMSRWCVVVGPADMDPESGVMPLPGEFATLPEGTEIPYTLEVDGSIILHLLKARLATKN